MINGLTASNRNTTLETLVPQRNVAPRLAAHPGWVARHAGGGNLGFRVQGFFHAICCIFSVWFHPFQQADRGGASPGVYFFEIVARRVQVLLAELLSRCLSPHFPTPRVSWRPATQTFLY